LCIDYGSWKTVLRLLLLIIVFNVTTDELILLPSMLWHGWLTGRASNLLKYLCHLSPKRSLLDLGEENLGADLLKFTRKIAIKMEVLLVMMI